jgi:protein-tyrosine kinase
MSRVSDALRRAVEEGGQGVKETASRRMALPPESNRIDQLLEPRIPASRINDARTGNSSREINQSDNTIDYSDKSNGYSESAPISASKLSALRSWVEYVLFGHGLRRIAPYPLVALEKNSHAGEQYKILREQITKIVGESRNRLIAITSPIKGDGKTTVAANLAAAMALHRERQVLLIDADLRSPSIHRYFGIKSVPGLADYLSSDQDVELLDFVQDTDISGLRVLPAGKATSHSAELLASERMRALVEEIASEFQTDQVIIDTSPVLSTSDPLVLSRRLEGLVMVVRAGKTPRDCLSEAIKLVGADKIMGLILNGAELGPAAKYYYYYGQQS